MNSYRMGIDLGGTKIASIVFDSDDNVVHQNRIETPQHNYAATLNKICQLVDAAEHSLNIKCSVGIGTPGTLSQKTGLIKNANSTCLNGEPLLQDLQRKLNRSINISNDANCFALSEAYDGAARNASVVFGVIIGTGTGAGIVINQQIIEGANKIAGEWGHNPMPWPDQSETPGPECYCGRQGCIETFLSGPRLEADYFLTTNRKRSTYEIIEGVLHKDPLCIEALNRYEVRLAKALAHIINVLDPDIIVLGGGMSNIKQLYKNVPEIWNEFVFSDQVLTQLCPPKFGDASGVRGAARLC